MNVVMMVISLAFPFLVQSGACLNNGYRQDDLAGALLARPFSGHLIFGLIAVMMSLMNQIFHLPYRNEQDQTNKTISQILIQMLLAKIFLHVTHSVLQFIFPNFGEGL